MSKYDWSLIGVLIAVAVAAINMIRLRDKAKKQASSEASGDAEAKAAQQPSDVPQDASATPAAAPSVPPAKVERPKVLPPRQQLMADVAEREKTGMCLHCQKAATHGLPYPEPATNVRVGEDITSLWRVRRRDRLRLWQVSSTDFWGDVADWWYGTDHDAMLCSEHYATALMHSTRFVHEQHASISKIIAEQNDDAREFQLRMLEIMRDEADRVRLGRPKGGAA